MSSALRIVQVFVLSLLCGAAEAAIRLETDLGFDTNVTRREGLARVEGSVARVVLDLSERRRAGRFSIDGGWHAGAKHFEQTDGEDVLLQKVVGGVAMRLNPQAALSLRGRVEDRTARDPEEARDYTRVAASPGLSLAFGAVRLGFHGRAERFHYKADQRFDANIVGARALIHGAVGAWRLSGHGGWARHAFDGRARERIGTDGDGAAFFAERAVQREDESQTLGVGVRFQGAWLGRVDYVFMKNTSNSYGGTVDRQALRLSGTVSLPWALVAVGRVNIQRMVYADTQTLSTETLLELEDEGRSAIGLRLERALGENWSVVGQVGTWFSPFDRGPTYARRTVALGLAWQQ